VDFLGLNRYPDPHQEQLKLSFCRIRNTHTHTSKDLKPENLFCGVGSDEAIDALLRCFCVPGKDKILTCPPTYGMYTVSAEVNDVKVVHVPLNVDDGFSLQPEKINEALSKDQNIKMVYVCSPGNPTASLIRKEDVQQILEHPTFNGLVIMDEAYIDFAPEGSSLAEWVLEWPNLVVMQTLSKAFGLAGIRLGVAFAAPEVAALLNNVKGPYNISSPTSAIATAALEEHSLTVMRNNRAKILKQRDRMLRELPKIPGIGRFLGGTDSNFLLVEFLNRDNRPDNATAFAVYEMMAGARGVVFRFRGKELGCTGCCRITVSSCLPD
jgi:histidinol-phosphate aminotransferase